MYELLQKVASVAASTHHQDGGGRRLRRFFSREKSKVLVELRVVLSRQPGPGAFEELRETHAQIKDKSRQIKGLQSELKMFIAHRGRVQPAGDLRRAPQQQGQQSREEKRLTATRA